MKIFVTGAAGFIGRAVVQELLNHGHQVLGLARNETSAEAIKKAGAEPHTGSLEDVESLKSGAKAADGVIHLAFIHDFANGMEKATATDRAAIAGMIEAMEGTNKPLVIASGSLTLAFTEDPSTEDTQFDRSKMGFDRYKSEDMVIESKAKGVRGMVVRLTPTVHGKEDKGFIASIIGLARKNGFSTYVNDGSARWPAVHRLDAAILFRLTVEKGAAGSIYHAAAEQAIRTKDIAELIGKTLNMPVEGHPQPEAMKLLGFLGMMFSLDNPFSGEKTQKELGWSPKQPGLLKDMEENYFTGNMESKYGN